MGRQWHVVAAVVLVALLSACTEPTVAPSLPPPANSLDLAPQLDLRGSELSHSVSEGIFAVGRGLALAINYDADARRAVRDILRDSPWSAHRVTLSELLEADGGDIIKASMARILADSPEGFSSRVRALPELELLMPRTAHRRTWTATPGVMVVASLGPNSELHRIFDPDGHSVSLESFDREHLYLLLQPAEPRVKRINPQPRGVGAVIESASDGTIGLSVVHEPITIESDATKIATSSDRSTLQPMSWDRVTKVDWIRARRDDGPFDPWVEVLLEAEFFDEVGRRIRRSSIRFDLKFDSGQSPGDELIAEVLPDSGFHKLKIKVTELDSGMLGGDDDWGERDFDWTDRDKLRTIYKGDPTIDLTLEWLRRPSSVLSGVSVPFLSVMAGISPDNIKATAIDQYGYGLKNFSVGSWWVNDPYVATVVSTGGMGAIVTYNSPGSTQYGATVAGISGSGVIIVEEPPACPPPQIIC